MAAVWKATLFIFLLKCLHCWMEGHGSSGDPYAQHVVVCSDVAGGAATSEPGKIWFS